MNIRTKKLFIAWVILGVVLMNLLSSVVHAAPTPPPNNTGQALEIAPPVIYLSVSPGQTTSTQIYIRNILTTNLIVNGQANDFVAAGEDGTPKILLTPDPSNPFAMSNWVVTPTALELIPKEIKTMAVTLHVPADASPGDHYGIIRFTASSPTLKGTGVGLSTSLGSLMLVTVSGHISENLSVEEFSVNKNGKKGSFFESSPLDFVVRLKNSGNVHEEPTGQIQITDMFGKKVASLGVNVPPKNVLQQMTRKFDSPLDSTVIGNKRLFGHYQAKLAVKYGPNNSQTLNTSLAFWVIPYRLIAGIIILLIGGFFLLRYVIKRYNRHIISRSHKN